MLKKSCMVVLGKLRRISESLSSLTEGLAVDSMLKSRDITLPTRSIQSNYGFSHSHVWMWKLGHKEGWALKNWCFQTVVLEKTLQGPLDSKEVNQSILREINFEYSLEGLMLKMKRQYFGHLLWRADSLEKTLMLGKTEGMRRRGRQKDEMVR